MQSKLLSTLRQNQRTLCFNLRILTADDRPETLKCLTGLPRHVTIDNAFVNYLLFSNDFQSLPKGDDAPVRWYDTKSRNITARRRRYMRRRSKNIVKESTDEPQPFSPRSRQLVR